MPDDTQTTTTGIPDLDSLLANASTNQNNTDQPRVIRTGNNSQRDQRGGGHDGDDFGSSIGGALKKLVDALLNVMAVQSGIGNTGDPSTNPQSLTDAVTANIDKVNPAAVKSLTDAATTATDAHIRTDALVALGTIVDQKSDKNLALVTADTVKAVTQIAETDHDSLVRSAAQQTLAKIAEKRPDLVDAHMLEVVSKAATAPAQSHPEQHVQGWTATVQNDTKGRQFSQDDIDDNQARATAQNTLKTIQEKRPDLHVAASNDANHSHEFQLAGVTSFSGGQGKPDQAAHHTTHHKTPHHTARPATVSI